MGCWEDGNINSNLPAPLEILGLHKVNRELKINLDIGLQDGFLSWRSSGFFLSLTNSLQTYFMQQ